MFAVNVPVRTLPCPSVSAAPAALTTSAALGGCFSPNTTVVLVSVTTGTGATTMVAETGRMPSAELVSTTWTG